MVNTNSYCMFYLNSYNIVYVNYYYKGTFKNSYNVVNVNSNYYIVNIVNTWLI